MGLERELVLAFVVVFCLSIAQSKAQLQVGFYRDTCPQAENIVRSEVIRALKDNLGIAAGLLRMHFHDCWVGGCEGSVLLDSTPGNTAEKDSPINNPSLRGFEVIDRAKARLEAVCRGVVSCADVLTFATRDGIALTGGIRYDVPGGRRDGKVSRASDTFSNLPPPFFNLDQLTQNFASRGFTQEEMVSLSGAHTLGISHCSSFSNRLYSFNSTLSQDPSLDPTYAAQLKQKCPKGSTDGRLVVPMDPRSPATIDTSYYAGILANRGLFTSDQTLLSSQVTANQVRANAFNAKIWKRKFAQAMVKMSQLSILTGSNGEIRRNCRVVN